MSESWADYNKPPFLKWRDGFFYSEDGIHMFYLSSSRNRYTVPGIPHQKNSSNGTMRMFIEVD